MASWTEREGVGSSARTERLNTSTPHTKKDAARVARGKVSPRQLAQGVVDTTNTSNKGRPRSGRDATEHENDDSGQKPSLYKLKCAGAPLRGRSEWLESARTARWPAGRITSGTSTAASSS